MAAACPLCRREVITGPAPSECPACGTDLYNTPMGIGIEHARTMQVGLRREGWIGSSTFGLPQALKLVGLPAHNEDQDPTLLDVNPSKCRRNFGVRFSVSLLRKEGETWIAVWPTAIRLYVTRTLIVVVRSGWGTPEIWWNRLSEAERITIEGNSLLFVGKDGYAVRFAWQQERVKGPSLVGQVLDLGLLMSQAPGPDTTIVGEGIKRKYAEKDEWASEETLIRDSNLVATQNDMGHLARFMFEVVDCENRLCATLGEMRRVARAGVVSGLNTRVIKPVGPGLGPDLAAGVVRNISPNEARRLANKALLWSIFGFLYSVPAIIAITQARRARTALIGSSDSRSLKTLQVAVVIAWFWIATLGTAMLIAFASY